MVSSSGNESGPARPKSAQDSIYGGGGIHHNEISDLQFYVRFLRYTALHSPRTANELRAIPDFFELLGSDIYHGKNVRRLAGETAMTIPGATAGDWSQVLLRRFINRIGGDAYPSGIACNIFAGTYFLPQLIDRIKKINDDTGMKIILIGHSLGATLAKLISDEIPEEVRQVISMAGVLNSSVGISRLAFTGLAPAGVLNMALFGTSAVRREIDIFRQLDKPALVPHASLYTKDDGIITYKSCLRGDAEQYEIKGASHISLGMCNKDSFKLVAEIMRRSAPHVRPSKVA